MIATFQNLLNEFTTLFNKCGVIVGYSSLISFALVRLVEEPIASKNDRYMLSLV